MKQSLLEKVNDVHYDTRRPRKEERGAHWPAISCLPSRDVYISTSVIVIDYSAELHFLLNQDFAYQHVFQS